MSQEHAIILAMSPSPIINLVKIQYAFIIRGMSLYLVKNGFLVEFPLNVPKRVDGIFTNPDRF